MKIRNLIEDEVFRVIDSVCEEQEKNGETRYSIGSEQRLDAACYALNRLKPRYVSSGRGQTHTEYEFTTDPQLEIDIVTLVHEGLRRVTEIGRSYYSDVQAKANGPDGPAYVFPTMSGRILDATSFEPISDLEVELFLAGERAEMVDSRWPNPCPVGPSLPGNYSFWPAAVPAEEDGEIKVFEFELSVDKSGYEPLHHYFQVRAHRVTTSEARAAGDFRLPDLYLIP